MLMDIQSPAPVLMDIGTDTCTCCHRCRNRDLYLYSRMQGQTPAPMFINILKHICILVFMNILTDTYIPAFMIILTKVSPLLVHVHEYTNMHQSPSYISCLPEEVLAAPRHRLYIKWTVLTFSTFWCGEN